jgi:hypothetical protein
VRCTGLGSPWPVVRVDPELEQRVLIRRCDRKLRPLLHKLPGDRFPSCRIVDQASPAHEVEGVFVLGTRERMDCITPIASEISLLGRWDDESEDPISCEQRAHRMHARPPVGPGCRQKRQPDSVLIKQGGPRFREVRSGGYKLTPGHHAAMMAP